MDIQELNEDVLLIIFENLNYNFKDIISMLTTSKYYISLFNSKNFVRNILYNKYKDIITNKSNKSDNLIDFNKLKHVKVFKYFSYMMYDINKISTYDEVNKKRIYTYQNITEYKLENCIDILIKNNHLDTIKFITIVLKRDTIYENILKNIISSQIYNDHIENVYINLIDIFASKCNPEYPSRIMTPIYCNENWTVNWPLLNILNKYDHFKNAKLSNDTFLNLCIPIIKNKHNSDNNKLVNYILNNELIYIKSAWSKILTYYSILYELPDNFDLLIKIWEYVYDIDKESIVYNSIKIIIINNKSINTDNNNKYIKLLLDTIYPSGYINLSNLLEIAIKHKKTCINILISDHRYNINMLLFDMTNDKKINNDVMYSIITNMNYDIMLKICKNTNNNDYIVFDNIIDIMYRINYVYLNPCIEFILNYYKNENLDDFIYQSLIKCIRFDKYKVLPILLSYDKINKNIINKCLEYSLKLGEYSLILDDYKIECIEILINNKYANIETYGIEILKVSIIKNKINIINELLLRDNIYLFDREDLLEICIDNKNDDVFEIIFNHPHIDIDVIKELINEEMINNIYKNKMKKSAFIVATSDELTEKVLYHIHLDEASKLGYDEIIKYILDTNPNAMLYYNKLLDISFDKQDTEWTEQILKLYEKYQPIY